MPRTKLLKMPPSPELWSILKLFFVISAHNGAQKKSLCSHDFFSKNSPTLTSLSENPPYCLFFHTNMYRIRALKSVF